MDSVKVQSSPRVVTVVALDNQDEPALLALAASLAIGLDTHWSAAILTAAQEHNVWMDSFDPSRHASSSGVSGVIAGHQVVLGDSRFLSAKGISNDELGDWFRRLEGHGELVMFVALDSKVIGFFGIADAD